MTVEAHRFSSTPHVERIEWDKLARRNAKRAVWDEDNYAEATSAHVSRVVAGIRPLPNGAKVLDLGCGIGRLAVPISKRFPFVTVVGVDISPEMLRKMPQRPNISRLLCDGRTLPVVGCWAAYSMLTFQHVPNLAVADYILQVARDLRPRGPFVFQYVEGRTDQFLARDATEPLVRAWCGKAGLEVESIEPDDEVETWRWVKAVKP